MTQIISVQNTLAIRKTIQSTLLTIILEHPNTKYFYTILLILLLILYFPHVLE